MQLWRAEMPTRTAEGQVGSSRWVVGGVLVRACVIVDAPPVFRRWRGEELADFRAYVEGVGGELKLCRGAKAHEVMTRRTGPCKRENHSLCVSVWCSCFCHARNV